MQRRRVWYSGRVQGVGFRATARAVASRHAVTGWVRNEPDGRVALEVQGDRAEVEAYLTDLRRAMAGNIQNEAAEDAGLEESEDGFRIGW